MENTNKKNTKDYVVLNDGIKGKQEYPHESSLREIIDAIKDYKISQKWN